MVAPGLEQVTVDVPLDDLTRAVRRSLDRSLVVDDWRPAVQGEVGHVVGVRDADGVRYVVKLFPATAGRRAATEVLALRLAADPAGIPMPEVVEEGRLPDGGGSFVVMTRLPGVRWADRRAELTPEQAEHLHRDVAALLGRLHGVTGERFGGLVAGEPTWDTAWDRLKARLDDGVAELLACGGPVDVAEQVRRFVQGNRQLFAPELRPVLCHHDLNGGNVLMSPEGAPTITGVVDLERASWDDPLADLALTALHLWHHDPGAVDVLLDAYGVRDAAVRARLEVHVVLLALAERNWVTYDRPAGWAASVAALDELLLRSTSPGERASDRRPRRAPGPGTQTAVAG